jgi:hypothetical protein
MLGLGSVAAACALALSAAPARAAVTSTHVAGTQTDVACLAANLCVLGGAGDGTGLDRIACSSTKLCELAGTGASGSIEVASWNGRALSLHQVAAPAGWTDATAERIACAGSTCEVVGYAERGAAVDGLAMPVRAGRPGAVSVAPGDSLYGVACPTATLCYAAGYSANGGVVLAVENGVPGPPTNVMPDLFGIACHRSACTAAGEQPPPSGVSAAGEFYGTLVTLNGTTLTAGAQVTASGGYTSVAIAGANGIIAVGAAQGSGSEITTA